MSPTMLTTAFEYLPSCTDIPVVVTSAVSEFYWAKTTSTLQITVQNEGDDRFSSCQPSGWNSGPADSLFSFSPAVCPSGWTAYSLWTSTSSTSTAYCCESGYTLGWPIEKFPIESIVSPACFRGVAAATPPSAEAATTATTARESEDVFSEGMEAHNAWRIAWELSDIASLSPTPPKLTCVDPLATWVPGEVVQQQCATVTAESHHGDGGTHWPKSLLNFIMIGVPILGVAFLVCIGLCCWRACAERRKDHRAREAYERRMAGQQGSAL